MIYATRYHDFSAGHRVVGHESKCQWLHGHNYRVTFTIGLANDQLDRLGRVMDFGFIKTTLCQWLEDHWDHKFLMWEEDPLGPLLDGMAYEARQQDKVHQRLADAANELCSSIVYVPFNPTAENMALYLLNNIGPFLFHGEPFAKLVKVEISETRKCSAVAAL